MEWLRNLFRRAEPPKPAARPGNFFCIYCNARFSNDDLPRVIAHLKPHASKEEAELRAASGAADGA
ncbi:MAG: hypothetical protein KF794_09845 [Xanthobacteraceae bacterium]|nr:hypothetical protein [Xanthobacteraceae bacterium]QYK44095.1 MAG: hypothetical protein KF794_09845 [Xanthobacteraceae bacterium]